MRSAEIERWALEIARRVENQQPVEDSRVELKRAWPTNHANAARRIAGHANAARGETVLWLIGIDETGSVIGADYNEFSNWISQVESNFDQLAPRRHDVNVPTNSGQTIVAIAFETNRAPFVVKNPHFGSRANDPISLEVPWRDGTRVRSATRQELILILADTGSLPVLLSELEWNMDIATRSGSNSWQYRVTEFETLYGTQAFNALHINLQQAIREAYIAISHAQSLVRSYENASGHLERGAISRQMISARLEARPHVEGAIHQLQDFLGIPRTTFVIRS